ncbi:MAG: MFS transporter [Kordiimonadaceae bacterium]|nr:MFS transporter [Kordiimonadaceae bacterium]MBO6567310.1 MFS transporter [Kordiimonadaceae bacterium]MBO6963476.1 MFS transporter [Kordiimonadaceae bacterium]
MSDTAETQDTSAESDGQSEGYPSAAYGWYVVVLLTIAYIFSYIDRQVLSLLVTPLKEDFGLSDTQMGVLAGLAFAIFYATMGLPLGWLADRKPRKFIVAAGAIVWSLATMASGLSKNFVQMFMARMTVGVGEASLSPSAMSLISDMFPPERRAKAIALYSTGLGLGSGIAYIIVTEILLFAENMDLSTLAFLGVDRPWQVVFLAVGFPGVLLGLLFLTVKEPARKQTKQSVADGNKVTLGDAARYMRTHWLPLFGVTLMVSAMTVVAYTGFWLPALFERTWDWTAAEFSYWNGRFLIILAPTSIMFWGWLMDRLNQQGKKDIAFRITQAGLATLVIASVIFPLLPNVWAAFMVSQIANVGFTMVTAGGITALLAILPSEIRAQSVALYYMFISLTGLIIGPSAVPFFTDRVFEDEALLKYSMALVPLLYSGTILLLSGTIGKAYRQELAKFSD